MRALTDQAAVELHLSGDSLILARSAPDRFSSCAAAFLWARPLSRAGALPVQEDVVAVGIGDDAVSPEVEPLGMHDSDFRTGDCGQVHDAASRVVESGAVVLPDKQRGSAPQVLHRCVNRLPPVM